MKATKVDPGVMALVLILLTVLLPERDATQLHLIFTVFVLSQSVVSVLRIQGSERRTRPAWSGVTRRSRTHGAAR